MWRHHKHNWSRQRQGPYFSKCWDKKAPNPPKNSNNNNNVFPAALGWQRGMRRTLPCWLTGYSPRVVDFALLSQGFPFYQLRSNWALAKRKNWYFGHMLAAKTGLTMSYFFLALNKEPQLQGENNIIWKTLCFLSWQRLSRVRLAGKCLDRIICNSQISDQVLLNCGDCEVLEDEKGCGFIVTSVWLTILPCTTKFPEVFKGNCRDCLPQSRGKTCWKTSRDTRNDGDLSILGVRKAISGDRLAL